MSDIETRGIILSRQRTTKALFSVRGCAGCSAPLLFAYGINRFSHVVAYMVNSLKDFLLWNQKADDLETWYAALVTRVLPSLFK